MDILKAFVLNGKDYDINILWKDNEPLFRADEIAKIIGILDVHTSIRNFDSDEKVRHFVPTRGGEQEMLFLTEDGVYRLLMRSNKPNARPFQKWVSNILKTIRKTGEYKISDEIEKFKEEKNNENKLFIDEKNKEIEALRLLNIKYQEDSLESNHKTLVDSFNSASVIYFGKIANMDDNKQLIKIGYTLDIKDRERGLRSKYGSIQFFKVFKCEKYKDFEGFLLNHEYIKKYLHTEPYNGIKNSIELFLMNDEQINKAVNVANRSVSQFNTTPNKNRKTVKTTITDLKGDLKVDLENIKGDIQNIVSYLQKKTDNIPDNKNIIIDKTKDENIVVEYPNQRGICTISGSKIQRYSRDGKELIETYRSLVDVLRDSKIEKPSRTGIFDSAKNNTVYKNYRWALLERDLDDNTNQKLEESVELKTIKKGFVAELNKEKNKITKVYSNQKKLTEEKGYKSTSWISTIISRQQILNDHYYLCWSDCSDELQEEYFKNNELPEELNISPHQIRISRLDPNTNEVLHNYSTVTEVTTKYKMTRRTLYSAISGKLIKRDFKWCFTNDLPE